MGALRCSRHHRPAQVAKGAPVGRFAVGVTKGRCQPVANVSSVAPVETCVHGLIDPYDHVGPRKRTKGLGHGIGSSGAAGRPHVGGQHIVEGEWRRS